MNMVETSAPVLVSCDWLAEHLDDTDVRIIEVSSSPDDAVYREGHIPGAVWWFWKDALWHPTDREFVTPEQLARRLGALGVTPQTTIVIYGNPVQFGTYAFWALQMAGHQQLRLLDGGRKCWVEQGRPLTQDIPSFEPVPYLPGNAELSSRVGRDDIRSRLGQPGRLLLDVRSPEEFSGERVSGPPGFDHGAERAGRIPGAVHLFFRELVNEDDTFLPPVELRAILARAIPALAASEIPDPANGADGEIVTYCRLSHRATLAWFAMRYILGIDQVRVYDGSWTEWGSIVGFPIEKD